MSNQINISEAEKKNIEDYLNKQKVEYRDATKRLVETNQLLAQDDWGLLGTGKITGSIFKGLVSISCRVKENPWTLKFDGTFFGLAIGAADVGVIGDVYRSPKHLDGNQLTFVLAALGANLGVTFWDGPYIVGTVVCTGIGAGGDAGGGQGTFTLAED